MIISTAKRNPRSFAPPSSRALFMGLLLWLCACAVSQAQVETGKIVGSVKDASGALVTDAAITVTAIQTNVEKKTKTNGDGEYVVTELKSGEYTVSVEHAGFKKAKQAAFKLGVNQVVRVDFVLTVGAITEEMVVTAAEPLVESETSSLGQVIE